MEGFPSGVTGRNVYPDSCSEGPSPHLMLNLEVKAWKMHRRLRSPIVKCQMPAALCPVALSPFFRLVAAFLFFVQHGFLWRILQGAWGDCVTVCVDTK